MTRRRLVCTVSGVLILSASGLMLSRADETVPDPIADVEQLPAGHAECSAFGAGREKMVLNALRSTSSHRLSITTGQVSRAIVHAAPRTRSFDQAKTLGLID